MTYPLSSKRYPQSMWISFAGRKLSLRFIILNFIVKGMLHMSYIDLGTFWEKVLDKTKTMISLPIWEKVVYSGLFPFTLEKDILTLCSMQDYIKNLIDNNPPILSALERATQDIAGRKISIVIIDSSLSTEAFNMESNITDTEESSPKDLTIDSPPMPDSPVEPAPTESSNFIKPIYSPPVYIDQKNLHPDTSNDKEVMYIPPSDTTLLQEPPSTIEEFKSITLNEEYRFETFIVGNTNRVAYSMAQAVAEVPAHKFNPLFIYGQSGLGKTHLMHAIGHYIKEHHPDLNIMCISSEKFLNDFIESLYRKSAERFREKYRSIDVLMIDDIQFLQAKDSTLTEFFHTYNTLYNEKKQIILTSDTLPIDMKNIEDRLISRFEAGCIVTIDPPDLETRIAILQSKADRELLKNPSLQISKDAINYIASAVDTNIRSLEGAFNNVLMSASLINKPVTSEYAYSILKDMIGEKKAKHVNIEFIQDFISSYFKIKKIDLLGQKRTKQLAYPRQIAMYLCRELINASYPSIATSFGKKDHTTVLHAYEKIDKSYKTDTDSKKMIDDIISKINGPG